MRRRTIMYGGSNMQDVQRRSCTWLFTALVITTSSGCPIDWSGAGHSSADLTKGDSCIRGGSCSEIDARSVDKVDLLFVIDNSNSMADEQAALGAQLPKIVDVLTSGERFPGDPNAFPAVKDLHVGVVDTDLGTPGFNLPPNCFADGGPQAGRLLNTSTRAGCPSPRATPWASYTAGADRAAFTDEIGCMLPIGTNGCGFEQQLEAPFKALWPAADSRVGFLVGEGLGDVSVADGGNAGFLRNAPPGDPSLIAIVVVTDEEDCSVQTTEALRHKALLDLGDPHDAELAGIDLNLRCFRFPQNAWSVEDRYYAGFRGLRQGNEDLVVFGAIVGVPTELVEPAALPDFSDDGAREAFYDGLLGAPELQQIEDPATEPYGPKGTGNLKTSCAYTTSSGQVSTAYPPRRIVSLARQFGENGIVQSICQEDFSPVVTPIVDRIGRHMGMKCLSSPLQRQASGEVACDVIWELPAAAEAEPNTPTTCAQRPFLSPAAAPRGEQNERGGRNCVVKQLPSADAAGPGWYYDDRSEETKTRCGAEGPQRIAFSAEAKPPVGVRVKLDCDPSATTR